MALGQHLDRHLAVVLEILSQVDVRHATFAQVAFDLVAIREGGREPGGDLGDGPKMDRLRGFGEASTRLFVHVPLGAQAPAVRDRRINGIPP